MSIASSNHAGQIKQTPASTQGITPYSSSSHVSKADQDDFEKSLDESQNVEKSGWNESNQKQFSLSMFQLEHSHSMNHVQKMKEIYDGMNEPAKSKSNHRHS